MSVQAERREQISAQVEMARIPEQPRKRRSWLWVALAVSGFYVFALVQLQFDYGRIGKGIMEFFKNWGRMFPPDLSGWRDVASAAMVTIETAVVGTVFSIILSFFLAFLAADNLTPHPVIGRSIKAFASFLRAVPMLVWALIFIVAVGMGPFPGTLAIMTHSVGMLVKVYAQSVEEVDKGILEAMRSTGANWVQIVCQGVLPTVRGSFLSWSALRFELDLGDSVILGTVGAGGIGWVIEDNMRMYLFQPSCFAMLVVFALVFSVEVLTNRLKLRVNRLEG
ncbi:phosphonate ABC transporter, permease protein PhnE [Kyrpidia spormannii]|uniref:Phosphonate ABC transporter, permease protein PhnE n=1 Tax=Kyrpidia spormannii TaxID=2055160 RepID=A0A2K8NCS6_9BACL|nr:phosphonate ABC transporter, permease protein PhnE [Kyrpidia spormannii]ATY86132.1 phosphonate ABC transporter, permease protein PhnE [Kyrpidia spormannii]